MEHRVLEQKPVLQLTMTTEEVRQLKTVLGTVTLQGLDEIDGDSVNFYYDFLARLEGFMWNAE